MGDSSAGCSPGFGAAFCAASVVGAVLALSVFTPQTGKARAGHRHSRPGEVCFTFSSADAKGNVLGVRQRLISAAAEVAALEAAGVAGLEGAVAALRRAAEHPFRRDLQPVPPEPTQRRPPPPVEAALPPPAAPAPPASPPPRRRRSPRPRPGMSLWNQQDTELKAALESGDGESGAATADEDAVAACPGAVWAQLREAADAAAARGDFATDPQLDWASCEVGQWGSDCGGDARPRCLRVGKTRTFPPLYFPYANPKHDVDVSHQMFASRVVEAGMTRVWWQVLRGCCPADDGGVRGRVLDVGANFGWYSVFSAALGCNVVAWEPVPKFRAFLSVAVRVNGLSDRVEVRRRVVSSTTGGTASVVVPRRGIWGTAGVSGMNIDRAVDNNGAYDINKAEREHLDGVLGGVPGRVCSLKVDVEGHEPDVFKGAKGLISSGRVHNVFLEYSPGVYERAKMWEEMADMPGMLMNMIEHGYEIVHVDDRMVRSSARWSQQPADAERMWAKPPFATAEGITAAVLSNDLFDAEQMRQRKLTRIPEGLSPGSLHAAFGHNTNVWAALKSAGGVAAGSVKIGRSVGVGPDSPYDIGGRVKTLRPKP